MSEYLNNSYIDRITGSSYLSTAALHSSALNTSQSTANSRSNTHSNTYSNSLSNSNARQYLSPTRSSLSPSASYSSNQQTNREFTRSSTSVLAAFRELQTKAKRLEMSRADTIRQCEDLRDAIARIKRTKDMWQRQNESETMETMLNLKAQCEQLRRNKDDYQSKVRMLEEQNNSHHRNIAAQKARLSNLEEDINNLNGRLRSERFKAESTSRDLSQLEVRCENLDEEAVRSPVKHRKVANQKRETLAQIEAQVENVKRATFKSEIKAEALRKYIDLLMNINGDLCTTLTAREMTKDKILELAKKYAPPRYSWPKHFEYVDMVKLLTDAAMTAAKDGALARATAATMAAVGLSPYKSSSPLRASLSNSNLRERSHSAPASGRRVTLTDSSRVIQTALMDEFAAVKSNSHRIKKRKVSKKRASGIDSSNPNAVDIQLAKTAARIAKLSLPTHSPDVDSIPSFRLALSARTRQSKEYVSPTATRSIGPPIHGDSEGVFVPSGTQSSRDGPDGEPLHNEYARRSVTSRAMNQSVAQFHSTVKSMHGDTF